MHYPGEVELDLKYPTLISWVHFKHNVREGITTNFIINHEMLRGKRFFRKIGKTDILH